MKIASIETFAVRIPLKPGRVMITALGRHAVSDYLLVRLRSDDGGEGVGEATVLPNWSGETWQGAHALIQQVLAPAVLGCPVADLEEIDRRMDRVCRHNWFTKAAIEMACWDLLGKARRQPVYELLGGAKRNLTIRSRFSMGAYDPPLAAQRAAERVAEGFTTIKVKVGGDPRQDVARVRAVREAIGPNIDLMIDANCGWDVDTAIRSVRELADCHLTLVEQPTPDGDFAGLARVRRETGCKILADDICFDLVDAQELVRNQCCDVISVYPGKNGGLRKAKAIVDFAAGHGIPCSIGSNLEWDIATAAMAHLVVACENVRVEDYPGDMLGPDYHEFSIVQEPLPIRGPLTTLSQRPGLGVEVDWDRVEAHRLK